MVEDVVSLFGVEMDRKPQVKIKINIHNNTPNIIYHDKNALTQLIFALLSNSVKYTTRGNIIIEITHKEEFKIIISDTGIGIKEEQKAHLFQLYGKALDSEFGMGIGLNLCKNIVEGGGGNIQLESEENIGTRVTIKFPCRDPLMNLPSEYLCDEDNLESFSSIDEGEIRDISWYISESANPLIAASRGIIDGSRLRIATNPRNEEINERIRAQIRLTTHRQKERKCKCAQILIVDDIHSNILVLGGLLRLLGLISEDARDGKEALEKIIRAKEERKCCGNYLTVFMDCNMPIMNGYEATQRIVALIRDAVIHPCLVIGVTAYDSIENKRLCIDAGMTDVAFKPVSKSMLIQLCKKYSIL